MISHVLCLLLTHWGRVTHICVGNLTIIGSGNGLLPGQRQAIIWTNTGILLIGPLGTNFSEILIEILTFSFKKMHLKVSSAKWWIFCLGLNVLSRHWLHNIRMTPRLSSTSLPSFSIDVVLTLSVTMQHCCALSWEQSPNSLKSWPMQAVSRQVCQRISCDFFLSVKQMNDLSR